MVIVLIRFLFVIVTILTSFNGEMPIFLTSLQKYDFGGVYLEGKRHFDAPRIGTT
jgi:hypothetical protein